MALNARQHEAVTAAGHALLPSGPGVGKTTVLSHRAAHLLRSNPASSLVAVTFTRDAAAHLRQKILDRIPGADARVQAGTFHALCIQQLRDAGIPTRISEDAQNARALERLYGEYGGLIGKPIEEVLPLIEALKRRTSRWTIDEEDPLHLMYQRYEAWLAQQGKMDFTDLVKKVVLGMADSGSPIKPLHAQFLLVDEFQDCDNLQLEWTLAHAAAGISVTVVGDDDQAIYGWRGACGYEAMQAFKDAVRPLEVILDMTYRCAPQIVQSASTLIARNNPRRVQKALRTAMTDRGTIQTMKFATPEDEAEALVEAIRASEHGTWGVLARSNRQLDLVSEIFDALGEPYVKPGRKPFWKQPGPALFLSVVRGQMEGSLSGVEALLSASGARARVIDRLFEVCDPSRAGALHRFVALNLGQGQADDLQRLASLQRHVRDWHEAAQMGHESRLLEGVGDWMQAHINKRTRGGIDLDICVRALGRRKGTLAQRVARITRLEETESGAGAHLYTMHAAKGLEWHNVWVVRCEEGVMPGKSVDLDEERRLFYVAMTRASHHLTLSWTRGRGRAPNMPTRFLEEAGLPQNSLDDEAHAAAA